MPGLDLTADVVELTRAICDIETVSDHEGPLADAIEAAVRALPHLVVRRYGDTVVARTELGRDVRVVIAGHIDTVPLNGNLPTRIDSIAGEEVLIGRGTVDMKGGVAVQLKLAAEVTEPAVDVTWIWYDHEEVAEAVNGLNVLSQTHPEELAGDFAILGEPTDAGIEGGCNGNLRAEIRTFGRRSHSARGWVGVNAIHRAAPILDRLAAYEAATVEVDGLAYREGLNAVGISGGVAGNVIPDECMVHVNYRFAPSRSPRGGGRARPRGLRGLRRADRGPRRRRAARPRRARRARLRRRGRRRPAPEVRLDRRRPLRPVSASRP